MECDELTPEELEEQRGEPLPDREVLSVLPVPGSEIRIDEVLAPDPKRPEAPPPTEPVAGD
jgi:hypothetical protein